MRIRNVVQEFEVKLEPSVDSPQALARGKGEWKVYENGTRQCKLFITKLSLENYPKVLLEEIYNYNKRWVVRALHRNEHLDDIDAALKS